MKCDDTLLREISKAAGKTRAERIAFVGQCAAFSEELGKAIKHNNGLLALTSIFDRTMLQYPRAVTACCVAATIRMRDGMSRSSQEWAQSVLDAWKATESHKLRAYIDDNLHHSRIEEYAGSFIRCTSV